jgi:hypothetical protein
LVDVIALLKERHEETCRSLQLEYDTTAQWLHESIQVCILQSSAYQYHHPHHSLFSSHICMLSYVLSFFHELSFQVLQT